MLVGKSLKSPPFTYSRGFKKLPRLHYQPEKGVAPVFSPYAGNLMYSYVHKSMCRKYNLLIEGSMDENKTIEEVIVAHRMHSDDAAVLNGGGEVWNWTFMWLAIYPYGKAPSPWMLNFFDVYFGGFEQFKKLWKEACMKLFGSGWVWLVDNDGFIEIMPSPNSGTPTGLRAMEPALCINLWERAYYTDFKDDKEAYIDAFLLAVNWGFVEGRLKAAPKNTRVNPAPESWLGEEFEDDTELK